MKFFHIKALVKRNSNRISALNVGGQWCYDNEVLQEEAVKYFSSLYSLNDQVRGKFPSYGYFSVLDSTSLNVLKANVSNEEIRSVLFSVGFLKALGPDGIHTLFYQSQWEMVGTNVCNWVRGVFFE